ncbi:hypothetical protein BJY18_006273 [Amycolatopsis jiangsuensis]|uniref:Uncharacterized protein n=1 Tax=Amycolatopsis jiangsuensis TaxID=1181879 RepID=A0A840J5V4_9PSEU|nr:hypothetical protein [Amycolatopsis jiangsuensis]
MITRRGEGGGRSKIVQSEYFVFQCQKERLGRGSVERRPGAILSIAERFAEHGKGMRGRSVRGRSGRPIRSLGLPRRAAAATLLVSPASSAAGLTTGGRAEQSAGERVDSVREADFALVGGGISAHAVCGAGAVKSRFAGSGDGTSCSSGGSTLKSRDKGDVRPAPCPPELTGILRRHIVKYGYGQDGRLFVGEGLVSILLRRLCGPANPSRCRWRSTRASATERRRLIERVPGYRLPAPVRLGRAWRVGRRIRPQSVGNDMNRPLPRSRW